MSVICLDFAVLLLFSTTGYLAIVFAGTVNYSRGWERGWCQSLCIVLNLGLAVV